MDGPRSTNATAIWLGHNWMQLFLASWVGGNHAPDTPVSQLKDIYSNIESTLPFPDLCRVLSLSYRFPGCGHNAQEDLYLFLGRIHEENNPRKQEDIKLILSEYLAQRWRAPSNPLFSPSPSSSAKFMTSKTVVSDEVASKPDNSEALQMNVREESVRSGSSGPMPVPQVAPPSGDNSRFTSSLKARGNMEGVRTMYDDVLLQETPPVWKSVVSYAGVVGVGVASTKKEAQHLASREVCMSL